MNYNMDAINEHRAHIAELQAQLDAANARIAELEAEYKLHREASLADFLKQSDEHKSEIERLKSRVAFDCRQLLAERDARIAELEAAQAWVSVDERLPSDEDEGVIVWTNNGNDCKFYNYDNRIIPENKFYNYDIGFYHEKNGWMLWTEEWEHGDPTVTHWMPLPPPPVTPET